MRRGKTRLQNNKIMLIILAMALFFNPVFSAGAVWAENTQDSVAQESTSSSMENSSSQSTPTENSTNPSTEQLTEESTKESIDQKRPIEFTKEPILEELVDYEATEADLHEQENISLPQMEAYLAGDAYQPKATPNKIVGSMTQTEYNAIYAEMNQQQNEAWNRKFNFKPETKVAEVSTYELFKSAFNNDTVSKIVLTSDITSSGAIGINTLRRSESIEIDGQGHTLHLINGSINVDSFTKLSDFKGAFSDKPVFHMHDIQVMNGTVGQNAQASPFWSFVNGAGDTGTTVNRGLWNYRIGNIFTPHDETKKANNQRIRGRLINASRGEVTIWGHNTIVTAAENFYTGGITVEPSAYYVGEIAHYDYSTNWFMRPVNSQDGTTGTEEFRVGDNSFVYLHNTNDSSSTYPAVYEHYQAIRIGKNATYNASSAGAVQTFNRSNAMFVADEGASVSLLSRKAAIGYPTLIMGASIATHGSELSPENTKVEFKPGTKVFIVGTNSTGAIGYRGTAKKSSVLLDSPETFDIRNMRTNTGETRAFLGDTNYGRGEHTFTIQNSDISLWRNTDDMDGSPFNDFLNVGEFKVSNAVPGGTTTSTNGELQEAYTRPNFKRISGMNSTPELIWTPVTDADYTQKTKALIGYTALGGEEPFDENGDMKTKPVYGDDMRKAYVDYTDTLGNTYRGTSTADNFIHWKKADHSVAGFQLANQEMAGIPYRAVEENGTIIPYRLGSLTKTTVIDVTPPDPALVNNPTGVSPVSKKISGKGTAGSTLLISINDVPQPTLTLVIGNDGNWEINLPKNIGLAQDDVIQFFLRDNAGLVDGIDDPPSTNSVDGNINPKKDLPYRDAIFKAATTVTVNGILELVSVPDNVSFGTLNVAKYQKMLSVDETSMTSGLRVSDTRDIRTPWRIVAAVEQEMTSVGQNDVLDSAFKYMYKGTRIDLTSEPKTVYQHGANDDAIEYNISQSWGLNNETDGLKFHYTGNKIPLTTESYRGTIKWTLENTLE